MNGRIQELAKQAREEVRAEWDKGNKIPYPEAHYEFQNDNDQKFAELIVDQCFKVALVEGKGYLDPIKLRDAMKKHFGVEE